MTTESAEDYIEAIYELIEEKGEARTKKLAAKLGVSPPSVSEMLQKLDSQGLVDYDKYKAVKLTDKGRKIAKNVIETHKALKSFFKVIRVPERIAEMDACKAEHKLNPKTVQQLIKFSKFLKSCPKNQPDWAKHFETYSKTGKRPDECCKD